MSSDLYAFLGGIAQTGARYKIEIIQLGGGAYQANAYNAGGSTAWTAPTLVAEGELGDVLKAASTKFAEKTRTGRDRTYTRPFGGGPLAQPFPKAVRQLPEHPLCWVSGRDLATLPAELRHRAILAPGQAVPAATAAPTPPVRASARPTATGGTAATTPWSPPAAMLGQIVMLCETIGSQQQLDLLLDDDGYLLTEKMEGDRGQLHHDEEGEVFLTNRSGEVVNCPPDIAAEMKQRTPPGTSLDGEVISVDMHGRAQLYVGAQADVQLFIAFDLLHHPMFPHGAMRQPQLARLQRLSATFPMFTPPIRPSGGAIRTVAWAEYGPAKREMLAAIRARSGEGVVMRDTLASYVGVRSSAWLRWRDRLAELDAVVINYRPGKGRFARTVGAVEVALYDGAELRSIGWVGSG